MAKAVKQTIFIFRCAAVVAISLLYFFIDARETQLFPKCPFHSLTGLFCPGCGSQRAISALLHFDIVSAIRFNILLVASLPMIGYSVYASLMNTFTTVKVQQRLFHSVTFIWSLAVVVLLFSVLRNLPIYPFYLLAPHH
jgi:hypothetical protein